MKLLSLSIDLTKIDKTRIVEGKNGGKYYNLTIELKDAKDQYGNDVSTWTSQSKDERDAKQPRVFLGNGRTIYSSEPAAVNAVPVSYQAKPVTNVNDDSDLPF